MKHHYGILMCLIITTPIDLEVNSIFQKYNPARGFAGERHLPLYRLAIQVFLFRYTNNFIPGTKLVNETEQRRAISFTTIKRT